MNKAEAIRHIITKFFEDYKCETKGEIRKMKVKKECWAKNKEELLRNLFFGGDLPLEAKPIGGEKYLNAWKRIELLRDNMPDNEETKELFARFDQADDERAFYSFMYGIEIGRLLYS